MKLRVHGALASFMCPGCHEEHLVKIDGNVGSWAWNGSIHAPTIHPSVKVAAGHHASGRDPGEDCWCGYDWEGQPPDFECKCCHSFIEVGNIRFLDDCTHALAGQTVPLPDIGAA
jgi:hypothetical protein